jgi:hypothetical protein
MAHYARIEGSIVRDVVALNNDVITVDGTELESMGQQFLADLLGGEWVQCSYNSNPVNGQDRGGYPGLGWTWTGTRFEPATTTQEGADNG